MSIEPMQSWEVDTFRNALDEMRCPYCGASNRENNISFECRVQVEVGENAGGVYHNVRDWGDMPELYIDQYQFDGVDHQIQCNACTLTTALEDWFLADKIVNEKLFFCISFDDKPKDPSVWRDEVTGAIHVRILESIRAKKNTPAGQEWPWVLMNICPSTIRGMGC